MICAVCSQESCSHLKNDSRATPSELAAIKAQIHPIQTTPQAPTAAAVPRRNTDADIQNSLKK
jgi:hypothetical protein